MVDFPGSRASINKTFYGPRNEPSHRYSFPDLIVKIPDVKSIAKHFFGSVSSELWRSQNLIDEQQQRIREQRAEPIIAQSANVASTSDFRSFSHCLTSLSRAHVAIERD